MLTLDKILDSSEKKCFLMCRIIYHRNLYRKLDKKSTAHKNSKKIFTLGSLKRQRKAVLLVLFLYKHLIIRFPKIHLFMYYVFIYLFMNLTGEKKRKKRKQWKVTSFLVVTNIFPRPIILPD